MPRPAGLPRPRRSNQPAVAVSGEIGGGLARPSATARTSELRPEARAESSGGDPKQRVAKVIEGLAGKRPADVLPALAELDEDELLAVLPPLVEVAGRLVPELLTRLESPRRPLRQAAAIVLGIARDRRAIDPLTALLGSEPTPVWVDVARALGNFGPRVVGPLCALLRGAAPESKEGLGQRVARTFAELVVSDGDAPGGAGRLAVENLLEVADPTVSSAARRALATLADVRGEARGTGGGADDREIRRFSTRAYEAITTPELDADGDIEVVGDD
jgi:HEAT repeat protein